MSEIIDPTLPPDSKRAVSEIYAYIALDCDGDEGIICYPGAGGIMPMVGADREIMLQMREMAKMIATARQELVRLVRFSVREELEILMPGMPEAEERHGETN